MRARPFGPFLLLVAVSAFGASQTAPPAPAKAPRAKAPAAKPSPSPSPTPSPLPSPSPTATPVPEEPARPRRPSIAIMAFDYGAITSHFWGTFDIGRGIADQIADVFVNDGTYRVIERSHLDTILAEQDFAQTDRASPQAAQLAKIGKVMGVRYIVAGSITQFATSDRRFGGGTTGAIAKGVLGPIGGFSFRKVKHLVQLTGRLIDTTTGDVVVSAKGEGQSKKGQGVGVDMGTGAPGDTAGFDMSSNDYRSSGLGEAQEKAVTALVAELLTKKPEAP